MALTKCAKCKREWQAVSDVEPCPWCRASSAESSLAALRQRAEEAEAALLLHAKADGRGILQWQKATGQELVWPDQGNLVEWALTERDATLARAERAEACLRHLYDLHARGVFNLPDEHYAAITNAAEVLSSPPADASTMGGEREPAPYIPEPWGAPDGEE